MTIRAERELAAAVKVRPSIAGIRGLFEVDVIRRRTQRDVLVFSIVYNLLAVGLAVAGKMNPLIAAALMPINSLLTLTIVGWGMRAAGYGVK